MESSRISVFYRGLIVLAGVVLVQLLMLGYQLRTQADIPLIRFGTAFIVEPVHRALNATSQTGQNIWTGYLDLRHTHQQNQALTAQLDQLKMANQQLQADAAEAQRLRGLLDLKAIIPAETVAARVLGGDRKSTRLNSSHVALSRMPSSA